MRRINVALILTILLVLSSSAHAQTPAAFRVLFGVHGHGWNPLGWILENHPGGPIQPGALAI